MISAPTKSAPSSNEIEISLNDTSLSKVFPHYVTQKSVVSLFVRCYHSRRRIWE